MPQASEQAAEFLRRLALCGRNLGEHDSAAKPSARELLLAGDICGIAQLDGPLATVLAGVVHRKRNLQQVSPRDRMTLQVSPPRALLKNAFHLCLGIGKWHMHCVF